MTKQDTHERLMAVGVRLLLQTGYHGTGLQKILEEANVPKGSFYHFFASKDDFVIQVLNQYFDAHRPVIDRYLHDTSVSPRTRLERYFGSVTVFNDGDDWRGGCLVGNLSNELAEQKPEFRAVLDVIFTEWRAELAAVIAEGQTVGEINPRIDADTLADFCLNSWEGAIMQTKVRADETSLKNFMQLLFETILRP